MKNLFNLRTSFALLGMLYTIFSYAHISIAGTVLDATSSAPIWGANVYSSDGKQGTVTDELGKFVLICDSLNTDYLISYIGYESKSYTFEKGANNVIYLNKTALQLEEIKVGMQLNQLNNHVGDLDLSLKPVSSSQEILRFVPGLFIGQHAGGGKAEQIFLRGYDIDHGTDLSINVDEVPVNQVSHAHGQGYSDLHYLIPELISKVDFDKGPYNANYGNFATAGFVNMSTINRLQENKVQVEAGSFNTFRFLGMVNLLPSKFEENKKQNAFLATEIIASDGPFESPQNFKRFNIFYKHSYTLNAKNFLKTQASYFTSSWDASGQIPESAVASGLISRFGAIDPDEGGETNRVNVSLQLNTYLSDKSSLQSKISFSQANFTLFSNFTFFLEDSINGDRIKQQEVRNTLFAKSTYAYKTSKNGIQYLSQVGVGLRYDAVDENELSHVLGRDLILDQYAYGNVDELNSNLFASQDFQVKNFLIQLGLRFDMFNFRYQNKLNNEEQSSALATTFNPKLRIAYKIKDKQQIYFKIGSGFHSNDTRSAILARNNQDMLPKVYGADLGTNLALGNKLYVNLALWTLYQQNELVYVGDAGIVEENGKSLRQGLDLSARLQLVDFLFFEGNFNYTRARSLEAEKGEDYIPLAPSLSGSGGLYLKHKSGVNASLSFRSIAKRPANEDFSLTAKGYTVFDLGASYRRKKYEIGFVIQNLLNTKWREAQFATLSKVSPEAPAIEEIHYTPGNPFSIKGKVAFFF